MLKLENRKFAIIIFSFIQFHKDKKEKAHYITYYNINIIKLLETDYVTGKYG